jgi:hypothetical protein
MASLNGLTVNDTGNLTLPSGTTGTRPSAAVGQIRHNSTTTLIDFTQGSGSSYYDLRALGSTSIGGVPPASQMNGVVWFNNNTPYYGVENSATFQYTANTIVQGFSMREANTTTNTSHWFMVVEASATAYRYHIVAAWRFRAVVNDRSTVYYSVADAVQVMGIPANFTTNTDNYVKNQFLIPSAASYGNGSYYVGWVSSDPRFGNTKSNAIYNDSGASGGATDYNTVDGIGYYPDGLGVGGYFLCSSGRDTGNRMHISFNYRA